VFESDIIHLEVVEFSLQHETISLVFYSTSTTIAGPILPAGLMQLLFIWRCPAWAPEARVHDAHACEQRGGREEERRVAPVQRRARARCPRAQAVMRWLERRVREQRVREKREWWHLRQQRRAPDLRLRHRRERKIEVLGEAPRTGHGRRGFDRRDEADAELCGGRLALALGRRRPCVVPGSNPGTWARRSARGSRITRARMCLPMSCGKCVMNRLWRMVLTPN
jgi:hypothetical protein